MLSEYKTTDLLEELVKRQAAQIVVIPMPQAQAAPSEPKPDALWLNKKEACAHLGRSYHMLKKYIDDGLLEVEGEGRGMLVNVMSFGKMPKKKKLRVV